MRAIAAIDASIRRMHPHRHCADKHRAAKLGEKSEYFCRQLRMLGENPPVIPPNPDLADAIADFDAGGALRPRLMRLTRLAPA